MAKRVPVRSPHAAPATDSGDPLVSARVRELIGLGLIAVAACLAYGPALDGNFLWDDDGHVTKAELRSAHGLTRIWTEPGATQQYYPLLHTGFWIQHKLFGDKTLGYHRVNLLLHLGAAWLVYAILRKLEIPGAMLATAIFALHPVQVETVAWITEQKNTLSAVFYLGAMLAYLHFDTSRKNSQYALALVLFVLGLMSKTVTATLPAALLVVFWWQRGRLSWRRDVLPLVPFFVFGALGGVVTAYFERTLIGATGEEFDLSLIGRVLLAGRVIWFYLGKLIWPTNLMFWYPRWTIDPAQFSHWLYPLAAIGATIGLWAIRGRWRAPLGAWLFFVGTLSPVLGFLNVYPFRFSYVADHFQYLACLGPIVLAAAGITLGIARLPLPVRPVANAVAVALAAGLTLLTWFQSAVYADPVTLYEDTLAKNPDCWAAHNNLGEVLKNQTPRAAEHFRRALELKPNYAEAHNNLGTTLLETGQTDAAIKQFVAAIELRRDVPDWYINLANALTIAGRAPEAIPILEHVVQVAPEFAEAENNLADALLAVGRPQEAIAHAEKALQLEPSWPEPRSIIGNALLNMNRPQEAAVRLNEAVRINPEFLEAWANLGVAYALSNQRDDAVAAIGRAMDLARANGRSASVQQLQRRLDAYRAGILNFRDQPPSAAQPSPASENSKSPPSP